MRGEPRLAVVVAAYLSSTDAQADVSRLDDSYWQGVIAAYEACLVATDAWAQVSVAAHTSRRPDDLAEGPIHNAFTVLFGGPFVTGKAPPLPADHRLTHEELVRIGGAMGPASVGVVVLVQAEDHHRLTDVFVHADWVALEPADSTEESASGLASIITALMQRRGER